jgi:chromosome segregation ATPase
MRRWAFLLPMLLLLPARAAGQGAPKDSQTLQDLLAEVRQLRQELQTTTIAVERAQILLYRVRSQQEAVAQATQRLDQMRSQLGETRARQKEMSGQLKWWQEAVEAGKISAAQQKEVEEQIPPLKARIEALGLEEQERLAKEAEAEQRLRDEQAKLAELESQLDHLDAELQKAGRPSANQPQ